MSDDDDNNGIDLPTKGDGTIKFPSKTVKPEQTLDYNRWVAEGYLEVIKNAIRVAAEDPKNETGKYNFEIDFKTAYKGLIVPEWVINNQTTLKIILNNQYFDLVADDDVFEVTLFFNNVEARLTIPFKSIVTFKDGHNGFLLSYEYPPEKSKKPVVELVPDEPEVAEVVSLDAFRNKGDKDK